MTPILMLGAGRMGGALVEGWRAAGTVAAADLLIRDPEPGPQALAAGEAGARLDPPDAALAEAKTVFVAVKPQTWMSAAAAVAPWLASDAVVISVMAGVRTADIAREFNGHPVARVMPTIAAAVRLGTFSLYADDPAALSRAAALLEPLGEVVPLTDEDLLHAATGVSGSAPAYLYAFVEALEAGGMAAGLPEAAARTLARSTMSGAAALMGGREPADLRRQVTSPGGTTEAALEILMGEGGLEPLLREAVAAATRRSRELGS